MFIQFRKIINMVELASKILESIGLIFISFAILEPNFSQDLPIINIVFFLYHNHYFYFAINLLQLKKHLLEN